MLWYVVQVHSGYEKRVKAQLEEAIQISDLEEKFGRILIPSESIVEMKGGQKRKSERKFFPGYVIVEMSLDDESWQLVKSVSRVLTVIGGKNKPLPLSKKEVEKILSYIDGTTKIESKLRSSYSIGEVVRVLDGPFSDFTGVVENVNYEKSRLQVAVSIFGRSTPVELEFSQVEKES